MGKQKRWSSNEHNDKQSDQTNQFLQQLTLLLLLQRSKRIRLLFHRPYLLPPLQKPAKRQAKPMPREFKTASSYAEKRLLQAVKEKADHVGEIEKHTNAIRKLDTEISELVPIIRALGGKIDTQAGPQQQFNPNPSYQHSFPPIPSQLEENTPSIDPALFHANSGPVPKTASMNQNPIMIPGAPIGGTEELNYSPEADIRWV